MRFPGRRLSRTDHLRHAYREHFDLHSRERQLMASAGFFVTFAAARSITHAIKAGKGPFHNIGGNGGTHIHHMTFGIIGNLIVGYLWVVQVGTQRHPSPRISRITSFVFGAGAALTLDEFALWLNLEDDYWTQKGRESIDAVVLFGTLLSIGALGGGVLRKYIERINSPSRSKESANIRAFVKDQKARVRSVLTQS